MSASHALVRGSQKASLRKVLLTTRVPDESTAWSKARVDVCAILQQAGYETIRLPQFTNLREVARLWSFLRKQLAGGGHMLIEYPFEQRKRAYFLLLFRLFAPVKLFALLHDLDSLRFEADPGRELAVLGMFDGLISHNAGMTAWLRSKGYTKKIVELGLFDYLSVPAPPVNESSIAAPVQILYAGNLTHAKATYIYDQQLGRLKNARISAYGPYFDSTRAHPGISHKGVFDPDCPALDRRYHFGLVWEGDSLETCGGPYGRYLKYNNPHKASLYISLGLPIVVWSGAALAHFVLEQGIGVTIDRLDELDELAAKVDDSAYLLMARRVAALRLKIAAGDFLVSAAGRLAG